MTPDAPSTHSTRAPLRAMIAAGVLVAAHVASRAARDALFLDAYSVAALPQMLIAGAILSVLSVVACAYCLRRFGPARVVTAASLLGAGLYLTEGWFVPLFPRTTAILVFFHVTSLGALSISAFWSFVNERFDPYSGKKGVARTEAAATLGGALGGFATERVASVSSLQNVLFLLSGLMFVGAVSFVALKTPAQSHDHRSELPAREAVPTLQLARDSYLRKLGVLVFLVAVASTLMDYVFKAEATRATSSEQSLARLFAIYYSVVSVLSFLVQSTVGHRLLQGLGAVRSIASLPSAVAVFGAGVLVFPGFWGMGVAKGIESVLQNTLYRSGYELLYIPVSAAKKRKAKAAIDVGLDKAGDAVGAGLIMLVVWWFPNLRLYAFVVVALLVSVLILARLRALQREYVGTLGSELKAPSSGSRHRPTRELPLPRPSVASFFAPDPPLVAPSPSHAALQDDRAGACREVVGRLLSTQPKIVREALAAPLPRAAIGVVMTLLADARYKTQATRVLRERAAGIAGQLVDTLLDPEEPFEVRRRMPHLLRAARSQRAAQGLFAALADSNFEIRFRSAAALSALVEEVPSIRFSAETVFAAAESALERQDMMWEVLQLDDEGAPVVSVLGERERHLYNRGLQHVFEILGLYLDRGVLRRALAALKSKDPRQRGTALEYLSEVLPEDLREKIWPRIDSSLMVPPSSRAASPEERASDESCESPDDEDPPSTRLSAHLGR